MADKNTKTPTKPKAPKAAKTVQAAKPTPTTEQAAAAPQMNPHIQLDKLSDKEREGLEQLAKQHAPDQAGAPAPDAGEQESPKLATPTTPEPGKDEGEANAPENASEAGQYCHTITDPVAARLYLQVRDAKEPRARASHRGPGRLTTAQKEGRGVRVRVVMNPDAHLANHLNASADLPTLTNLDLKIEAAQKRNKELRTSIENRLGKIASPKEWKDRMMKHLLGEDDDATDKERKEAAAQWAQLDPLVRIPCEEHAAEMDELLDSMVDDMEKRDALAEDMAGKERTSSVWLDQVYPLDASVTLQLWQV